MSLNLADLYIILQSLTKSQKRSFTIYFNSYKPDSNASALFKAINELKEYDREKLIEQLQKMGKHSIAENLIQEATSLYKLVLKKIMSMKKANAIVKELRDTLDEIIFLEEMGLFPKSQRMLKRLEKEVIEYDLKSL